MPVLVQTILDENTTPSSRVQKDLEIRILQHLEKQEDQGYDIRAVRAAIESTDTRKPERCYASSWRATGTNCLPHREEG